MYSVTSNFLTKVKADSRTFDMKVEIGSPVLYTLTPDDVVEWTIEDCYGNDNIPGIGAAIASVLTFKCIIGGNVPVTFGNAPIKPFIAIDNEWVPLGVFYPDIKSIGKDEFTIWGTFYDRMTFYESFAYTSALTYPTSIRNVANEMVTRFGVPLEDVTQLPNINMKAKPTGTVRSVISELAELAGRNATLNREGELSFRKLTSSGFSINDENYIEFSLASDDAIVIDKLVCAKEPDANDNDLSIRYGSGTGATLIFENANITTVGELTSVYNLGGFPLTYKSYTMKTQGFPMLDCGDTITLTTRNNVTHTLPIIRHKLSYNGGLISEFEAAAPQEEEVSTGSVGANSITQSINTLQINMIKADAIYTQSIDALSARIGTIESDYITVGELSAGYAEIDLANITNASIKTAMIADAQITTAKIADAAITSAKIENATITNADIANATIEGAKIANATIDTANIKDAAITTAKITDANITNAKIANAAIDTAKIADAAITNVKIGDAVIGTAKIQNGAITTAKIDTGAITTALIATGAITTAQIADASITDAKIVSLSASRIDAGTLSVDRLIISGSEQSILFELNNSGALVSTSIDTLDGYVMTPRTITADKIVANAITANEMAAKTITANEIAANTITAAEMTADSITAREIAAGAITVNEVSSTFENDLDLSSNQSINLVVSNATADLAQQSDIDTINTYLHFDTDGLTIGKTDSPMQVSVSNTEIDFIDNGVTIAYINGQKMYIKSLEITESILMGNHRIEKYTSGTDKFTLFKYTG